MTRYDVSHSARVCTSPVGFNTGHYRVWFEQDQEPRVWPSLDGVLTTEPERLARAWVAALLEARRQPNEYAVLIGAALLLIVYSVPAFLLWRFLCY